MAAAEQLPLFDDEATSVDDGSWEWWFMNLPPTPYHPEGATVADSHAELLARLEDSA